MSSIAESQLNPNKFNLQFITELWTVNIYTEEPEGDLPINHPKYTEAYVSV